MEFVLNQLSEIMIIVVSLLVFNYLKELPVFHRDSFLMDKEHTHKHKLQQEAYYREMSGEKMENLFQKWAAMFIDMRKMEKVTEDDIKQLAEAVFMYGSTQTIETFAFYMNHNFNNKAEKELGEIFGQYQIFIIAKILSDLKYDFTGYRVHPTYFIKSKINDYDTFFTKDTIYRIEKYIGKK
ncbi:hypothetical protein JXA27_09815 [Aerococcaceae bacterium zg-B36]|uniref:hypothetical protein n=1 Tax=Aerococcaceae bacterium zg-252 TaxID=2796928 RepID=UPI001BD84C54|nr:hypothetical protein [Aerococcaceae bacterium zg-B36]